MKTYFKVIYICFAIMILISGCGKNTGDNSKETKYAKETEGKDEFKELRKNMVISDDVMAPYRCKISGTTDEGIGVYFKEPENVDGYVVYRSYKKNKGYKIIANLGNTPYFTIYYDNTFDKARKKIYYKVRSFRTEDGEKTYSKFSSVIKAKYRNNLKLSKSNIFMFSDTSKKVNAYIGWCNAKEVVWESDNEQVATVSEDGTINAVSKGSANITCSVKEESNEYNSNYKMKKNIKVTVDREDVLMLSDEIDQRYKLKKNGIYKRLDYSQVKEEDEGKYENSYLGFEKSGEARIMLVGDLMALGPTIRACTDKDGNTDYNGCYKYVKPVLETSDLAIGNLETCVASEYSYSTEEGIVGGWPNANVQATFLDALYYAGFDGFAMSNNHNADCGQKGVVSTIETLNKYSFPYTGIGAGEEVNRFIVYNVNGIKVGIISYTTRECGFNTKEESWSDEDVEKYLNYYSKEKAKKDFKKMKKMGVEYCICYMHWGIKNYFEPTEDQTETAKELADIGFDYIAGSHSHTVQRFEYIKADDGRKVPCIYSMGDFNAHINQIEGNRDAVLMMLDLRRDEEGNVVLDNNSYIPFYTYGSVDDDPYVSIPLHEGYYGGSILSLENFSEYKKRIADEIGKDIEVAVVKDPIY